MKYIKRSYRNENWYKFSDSVQRRDGYKCLKCGRKRIEVVLQVHHTIYKPSFEPWEYPLSDCLTLCKGCHAKIHDVIEPTQGWTLISINDLGDLDGICERKGCNQEIRYEHVTYHPNWGYKTVGSTCVEHLTKIDQFISQEVIKILKNISDFVRKSIWETGQTKQGNEYIFTIHSHHRIYIYENSNGYTFKIGLKRKGVKYFDYNKATKTTNNSLEQVKELGFIVLKGLDSKSEDEKKILRSIYKSIININKK